MPHGTDVARWLPWLFLPLVILVTDAPRLPDAEEGGIDARTMWGAPARQLEERLEALGFDPGRVDGRVETATIAAIRELQRCNGLEPSGRVGRSTASLLGLELEDLFDRTSGRDDAGRAGANVDRPSIAEDPMEEEGTDPLEVSSMPTVGDAEDPIDADDRILPRVERPKPEVAIDRDECLERERKREREPPRRTP